MSPARKPTADDFRPAAVQKAILSQTLQNPATIFPWVGSAVALLYGAIIEFNPTVLGIGMAGGMLGLGAWIFNFFIRGEQKVRTHIDSLRARRAEHKIHAIATIESECRELGFEAGAKEAGELIQSYRSLLAALQSARAGDAPNLFQERFSILAEDTYEQGIAALSRAVTVYRALLGVDVPLLERELRSWEDDAKFVGGDSDRYPPLQAKIESHRRRLESYRKQARLLQQLLDESNSLEAALEMASLEVVDLVGSKPGFHDSGAAHRLEQAVTAARKTEDRLRELEEGTTSDLDQEYLEQGRSRRPDLQ